MDENVEMVNELKDNNTEVEDFQLKGLNEALEITKEKEEKVRSYVDRYYKELYDIVEDQKEDFDILDVFSTLSKVSLYFAQSYFSNKDEFDEEYQVTRKLVTENVLQSLGVNADDEKRNKESIVTFNGELDLENFSLRRILMISSQITEYALWQLTLTKTFEKKANELN